HIPRRDQRQMELWQRLGTYAAGQALESAELKGRAEFLEHMDMIVSTGGGERDVALDEAMLSHPASAEPQVALNLGLMAGLRPTLFLAQLPNMLAGCISIVHGVAGSSRTFMGEEGCGAEAVRISCARIAAGQGELFLVGGAQNAARAEVILHYMLGGLLAPGPFSPIWQRQSQGGGMTLGSLGCFLVIESRAHASARGATAVAGIAAIGTGRCARNPGQATANANDQLEAMRGLLDPSHAAVISAASGAAAVTAEEREFLDRLGVPVRAAATAFGHSIEPAFPAALALAAMAVADGRLFPSLEPAEHPMSAELRQVIVTGWGYHRGEAMALVTRP
ncbi:MAG: beta-ketoacyl-ACP synthase, partial [Acetobacteraceae bacterium]|nr:beta-ketoacyl-ACP synthase [Acetobacteraceae bacterium]